MDHLERPDFGDVSDLPDAPSPRDLFCKLQDPEDNVHYFKSAFTFAIGALTSPHLQRIDGAPASASPADYARHLIAWAQAHLAPGAPDGHATSWPLRVAREFAPLGLTDGVWLQGAVQMNVVEDGAGSALLRQLMLRFGGPGSTEARAERYASLLRSIGVVPASVTRGGLDEAAPCSAISYEHALLANTITLFPSSLRPETIGLNLWMASVGPCPLLERLLPKLIGGERHGVAFFDAPARGELTVLAVEAVTLLLADRDDATLRARIERGFAAAHRSYSRWEQAMCGRNIPVRPRDLVLEMIRSKAQFAIGHHENVSLGGRALESYLADPARHGELLDHLASSHLIHAGSPAQSAFVKQVIAFGGPMFDVFTSDEQRDLREWITGLANEPSPTRATIEPIELEGTYVPPQDPDALSAFAKARYRKARHAELLYHLVNADLYPAARVYAKSFVDDALLRMKSVFAEDSRLNSAQPPRYSEASVADIIAVNHTRNIGARHAKQANAPASVAPVAGATPETPQALDFLDGCWLQGFADVRHVHLEEHGWLFRIYASELGDGDLSWNHNHILRKSMIERFPDAQLPLSDARLFQIFPVSIPALVMFSMTLNKQRYLPELLGLNLAIEAKGVGGFYISAAQRAAGQGREWTALYYQLHNSIDNYATGHTRWSTSAVQSFMARAKDVDPAAAEHLWHRVWRIWRFQEITDKGTDVEKKALTEALGAVAVSFAPSEAS